MGNNLAQGATLAIGNYYCATTALPLYYNFTTTVLPPFVLPLYYHCIISVQLLHYHWSSAEQSLYYHCAMTEVALSPSV
jgi:hypothetical protein